MIKKLLTALVLIYQKAISPLIGPRCRFDPTCSNYALQALKEYPTLTALKLIVKRVGKCHPWGSYGYDPLPEKREENKNDQ